MNSEQTKTILSKLDNLKVANKNVDEELKKHKEGIEAIQRIIDRKSKYKEDLETQIKKLSEGL